MIIEKSVIIPAIIIWFWAIVLVIWVLLTVFGGNPSILTYLNRYLPLNLTQSISLMLLACTIAYIILAAPILYRLLRNVITAGKDSISDYGMALLRIICTLVPPYLIIIATNVYFNTSFATELLPASMIGIYQQYVFTHIVLPMIIYTAAILILYLISYFHFRGDLKC